MVPLSPHQLSIRFSLMLTKGEGGGSEEQTKSIRQQQQRTRRRRRRRRRSIASHKSSRFSSFKFCFLSQLSKAKGKRQEIEGK